MATKKSEPKVPKRTTGSSDAKIDALVREVANLASELKGVKETLREMKTNQAVMNYHRSKM